MPKETQDLAGVITDWESMGAPRPSKFKLDVGVEEVELTIWPTDKGQEAIRSYLEMINPLDLVGNQVVATVKSPGSEYMGTKQYNLVKLQGGGVESASSPQAGTQPVLAPRPSAPPQPVATTPSRALDPNNRDTLIVDQVLFKGVIDRLNNGAALKKAIQESIAAWDGIRARHLPPEEASEPAPEADDGFGVIDLNEEGG